jgi:Mce-associated membrane protein
MRSVQVGKHRVLGLRARKGTITVPVEIDSATRQDEATVAEEATDQAASATGEVEATRDAHDTSGTTDIAEAGDSTSAEGGDIEAEDEAEDAKDVEFPVRKRRFVWSRALVFGVLPVLALLIAVAAGYLKWQDTWVRSSGAAGIESVAAAKESTVAILSYQPDSAEKELGAARDRLTGKFRDSYADLVRDVVVPGAKKDHIAAIATVPAAASVSATPNHAVALVYVDQTVTVGNDAPTDTASTVRVTMDKVGNRWLISSFDPI